MAYFWYVWMGRRLIDKILVNASKTFQWPILSILIESQMEAFSHFGNAKTFFRQATFSSVTEIQLNNLYELEVGSWHIFNKTLKMRTHTQRTQWYTSLDRVKLFERVKLLSIDEQNGHCAGPHISCVLYLIDSLCIPTKQIELLQNWEEKLCKF